MRWLKGQRENHFQGTLDGTMDCMGTGRPGRPPLFTCTEPPEKAQGHGDRQLPQGKRGGNCSPICSVCMCHLSQNQLTGTAGSHAERHRESHAQRTHQNQSTSRVRVPGWTGEPVEHLGVGVGGTEEASLEQTASNNPPPAPPPLKGHRTGVQKERGEAAAPRRRLAE